MKQDSSLLTPAHLPEKLAICEWQWAWLSSAGPGEAYENLESVMTGLRERAFNTVRLDAGLDFCFNLDGTPRGEMTFCQAIEGYCWNLRVINGKGGRHDVLKRFLELMRLAKIYDIYVIMTSWEYMHSITQVGEPGIRAEIEGIPEEERLLHLARQHDRLLRILKQNGLEKNIAYVEVHNEVDCSSFPKGERSKPLHTEAIAFLRDAHPDILIAGDFATQEFHIYPENTQLLDNHAYPEYRLHVGSLLKPTVMDPGFDPKAPMKTKLLRQLFRDDITSWDDFMEPAQNLESEGRRRRLWINHNVDCDKYDRWLLERFAEWEPVARQEARKLYAADVEEASRRNIPVVMDEGGLFITPLGSRFDESERARNFMEFLADLAIEHGFWGWLTTTTNGPEQPIWYSHPEWLRSVNSRFLNSAD